ncbi:MAG: GNAT family N-acetyltransferase [Sandaracinaceae bacterium]|nr:GNAT family N-acetyltransferase [Sandaracinaceae bacterium]
MDEHVLEAHVDLRLGNARHAPLAGSPRGRAAVRAVLERIHRDGRVCVADDGARVRAVLAWRDDPEPWCGAPVCTVAIDHDSAFDARGWIADTLDAELPRMEAELDLHLNPVYRDVYRALVARGVGVGSVVLLGEPATALAALGDVGGLAERGLEVMALEARHLDEALELTRAAFAAEPEHAWFGANEGFLAFLRSRLAGEIERPDHVQRVLLQNGRLLGHASASVDDDPLFGPTAGLGIVLAPELRGRGLSRPIYRALLEEAIAHGARLTKGMTSHPAVLRLGAVMGRRRIGLAMRRGATFGESHFAPYLPLA